MMSYEDFLGELCHSMINNNYNATTLYSDTRSSKRKASDIASSPLLVSFIVTEALIGLMGVFSYRSFQLTLSDLSSNQKSFRIKKLLGKINEDEKTRRQMVTELNLDVVNVETSVPTTVCRAHPSVSQWFYAILRVIKSPWAAAMQSICVKVKYKLFQCNYIVVMIL